jgi:hypothetical protein
MMLAGADSSSDGKIFNQPADDLDVGVKPESAACPHV